MALGLKSLLYTLDIKEREFRTKTRLELHPEWRVQKTKKRKIIDIDGEVLEYNLTVYYINVPDKNGKLYRKQFTYYHDKYLEKVGRSKYALEVKDIAFQNWKNSSKRQTFLPKGTYQNWCRALSKQFQISQNLEEKIDISLQSESNNLKKYNVKKYHNNILFVEIDDTYKTIQYEKERTKLMCRMLTFNLYNWKTRKYECLNNVQIYFNKAQKLTKYDEKNSLVHLINYIKDNYYSPGMIVCIKGDGAWNIKEIGKHFGYQVLDKFHLTKYIRNTFLLKKWFRNVDLNSFSETFSIKSLKNFWIKIIENCSLREWNLKYKEFVNWLENTKFKTDFKKFFELFLKYINNNKHLIFGLPKNLEKTSHTESYIRNYFKKYIYKAGTSYGFKTIISLVKINFSKGLGLLQVF